MKLRSIALLFACALITSTAAHAQAGAYAMFDAEQFTRDGLFQNPPTGHSNSDSPWLYGPTFGAFYTITHVPKLGEVHTGPIRIGIDGRGSILRTNTQYSRSLAIVSLRITPKHEWAHIMPYVQGGAGLGHTKVPGQANFTNNWDYVFAAGADRKLGHNLDWRVVEVSGGFMGDYVAGTSTNNSNHHLDFATGIVYRFH